MKEGATQNLSRRSSPQANVDGYKTNPKYCVFTPKTWMPEKTNPIDCFRHVVPARACPRQGGEVGIQFYETNPKLISTMKIQNKPKCPCFQSKITVCWQNKANFYLYLCNPRNLTSASSVEPWFHQDLCLPMALQRKFS